MKKQLMLFLSFLFIYGCSSSSESSESTPVTYTTIGSQVWSTKNLDVATYRDGTPIPQITDPTQLSQLTTGAWCYYNNDTANGTVYGKLYNWYAVNDPRGLAPEGWHVPSDAEWTTLTTFLGGESVAGGKMKETETTHWQSPNYLATNESGFTGLPGGWRNYNLSFDQIGEFGYWWSSSQDFFPETMVNVRYLCYGDAYLDPLNANTNMNLFLSVRCIKD